MLTRLQVNGASIAVEDRGDGPAILFIHGYPLGRSLWRHPVENLAGWRRIAPDLRGMGESSPPEGSIPLSAYTDDLIGVLDALSVDRAVICGLSMGGYIALDLVSRYRSRVAGLVLMATKAEADSAEARRGRDESAADAAREGPGAVADAMLPRLFAPRSLTRIPATVTDVRAGILATPVKGIIAALNALRDRPDNRSLLGTLEGIPTLVVAGADDVIAPPDGMRKMASAIPGAQFALIRDAGHLPPLEQPDVTTDTIAHFLRQVP